eukprot:SAG11_NODE_31232_length_293_cov_1.577320_1_plen_34_part_10
MDAPVSALLDMDAPLSLEQPEQPAGRQCAARRPR